MLNQNQVQARIVKIMLNPITDKEDNELKQQNTIRHNGIHEVC
jgi:hypothetical protein